MRSAMFSNWSHRARTSLVRSSLLTLPVLAPAQAPHAGSHSGAAGPSSNIGGKDMMAAMKERHEHMSSMPMTGKPDVDFAMGMRMHHLPGIRMAEVELRDGKEPKTRAMASKIFASQKKETRELEEFLVKHGHPIDKMAK